MAPYHGVVDRDILRIWKWENKLIGETIAKIVSKVRTAKKEMKLHIL